jgi:hypothetical protein
VVTQFNESTAKRVRLLRGPAGLSSSSLSLSHCRLSALPRLPGFLINPLLPRSSLVRGFLWGSEDFHAAAAMDEESRLPETAMRKHLPGASI